MPQSANQFTLETISTGTPVLDNLIGGYEKEIITTLYGPAGSGKTNLALIAVQNQLLEGNKVLFVDTEGSFSVARMMQLLPDFKKHADNLLFFQPATFDEQKSAFEKLKDALEEHKVSLIVVDSIAMLYRLEMGKNQEVYAVNKELGIQLGRLTEIARKKKIPIILTNQVYADFDQKDAVKMVGGDLMTYSSKCLVELKKAANGVRVAIIKKHRSLPEGKEVAFKIVDSGLELVEVKTE